MSSMKDCEKNYICLRSIHYLLYGNTDFSQKRISALSKGIQELIEHTDTGIQAQKYKFEYLYEAKKLRASVGNGHFVSVDIADIRTIYNSSFKMKHNLLRYYLFILSTILTKKEVSISKFDTKIGCIGYMYQRTIREKLGISESAQLTYNSVLHDLKLLYITQYDIKFHKKDGTFGSAPSVYGRYEDREYVEAYVKQHYPQAVEANIKAKTNYHKSMVMKYNEICKGRKYDTNTMWEVLQYITNMNNESQELIRNLENSDNPNKEGLIANEKKKIRDLTVFNNLVKL